MYFRLLAEKPLISGNAAEIDAIAELHALGMVDGVTTNPSLIMKSGRDMIEVIKEKGNDSDKVNLDENSDAVDAIINGSKGK